MRNLYNFFGENEKVPQAVVQIPWGHIRLILDKIKNMEYKLSELPKDIARYLPNQEELKNIFREI